MMQSLAHFVSEFSVILRQFNLAVVCIQMLMHAEFECLHMIKHTLRSLLVLSRLAIQR